MTSTLDMTRRCSGGDSGCSLVLAIPLVATSEMVMDWFGYTLDAPLMEWYGPVLGSIVFWWGGWPFLTGGVAELRAPANPG